MVETAITYLMGSKTRLGFSFSLSFSFTHNSFSLSYLKKLSINCYFTVQ